MEGENVVHIATQYFLLFFTQRDFSKEMWKKYECDERSLSPNVFERCMNMIQYSEVTGKQYETNDAVFYRNVHQSAFMISKPDMVLLDLFTDGNGMLVFCFPKALHRKYVQEWHNRPHEYVEPKEWRIKKNRV